MNQVETNLEAMSVGLPDEDRQTVVQPMNELLADMHVLYVKARNYHWNIVGDQFFVLHAEFEKLYDGLAEDIDEVAERIRAIGGTAIGSMSQFLAHARLKEASKIPDSHTMVADLLHDYEALISTLRGLIDLIGDTGDAGSEDFCTGMMEKYEKTAWMLRAFLR